jgi:Phage-integrase repeat unit
LKFLQFHEARVIVKKLRLKNKQEWSDYCKTAFRRRDIPTNPPRTYKKYWKGWGDWLGTGTIANQKRLYLPFEEAKKFVHSLNLRSQKEWKKYNTTNKLQGIPVIPHEVYENDWNGWGDWLGTGTIASFQRNYRPFLEAKQFIRNLRLRNTEEWYHYRKSDKKPFDIPASLF